jgi:hypothetical protein
VANALWVLLHFKILCGKVRNLHESMYYVKILLYRGVTGSNVGECQNNFVVLCIQCEVCSMFRLRAGHFCNFLRRVRKLERQKKSL